MRFRRREIEHERIPPKPPLVDVDPDKVDFSEFHPLDHSVWECRGYPGGRRRHLRYRWDFQWEPEIKRRIFCVLLGRHTPTDAWKYRDGVPHHFRACAYCAYRMGDDR